MLRIPRGALVNDFSLAEARRGGSVCSNRCISQGEIRLWNSMMWYETKVSFPHIMSHGNEF